MQSEEIKMFVADICADFNARHYEDNDDFLHSSGYYVLTSCATDNDATLECFVDINRTQIDGKPCFAIYHGADVDSCENICDPDWEYTENCTEEALEEALLNIADMYTKEKMLAMYAEL